MMGEIRATRELLNEKGGGESLFSHSRGTIRRMMCWSCPFSLSLSFYSSDNQAEAISSPSLYLS